MYTLYIYSQYSFCGWMYKLSSSAIGIGRTFKRRWLVLNDEQLEYFDDMFSLENPR